MIWDNLAAQWQQMQKRSKAEQAVFKAVVETVIASIFVQGDYLAIQQAKDKVYGVAVSNSKGKV